MLIEGISGSGKTALAVHWGHTQRAYFPDGELCVDLRGYDSGPAVTPEAAVEACLRAQAVPQEQIPDGLDARAALYRSLLDGRRVLIVLDNARAADQIRSLLPGSSGCLAMVTSRSRLASLSATLRVDRMVLSVLEPEQAVKLLGEVICSDRVDENPRPRANWPASASICPWPCASPPNGRPPTRSPTLGELLETLL